MSAPQKETRGFQTEVRQLLKLMIHSLYSNREIFLRELVSNASDANDRLRFEAIAQPNLLGSESDLEIRIDGDPEKGTLTIRDNGIGMTREEAIAHLGTIAKSGTAEFFKSLSGDQQKDSQLIGQFGVGFYSAFIVADRVEVLTRKAGAPDDAGVRWESSADGEFTVETVDAHRAWHGRHAAPEGRRKGIRRRLAPAQPHPPLFRSHRLPGAHAQGRRGHGRIRGRQPGQGAVDPPAHRDQGRRIQAVLPARLRTTPPSRSPGATTASRASASTRACSTSPAARRSTCGSATPRAGSSSTCKRVFIMDDAEQFLPLYLRFVKGVVDSADLPLNVSRELLQQDPEVEAIRSGLTKPRARHCWRSSPRTSRRSTARFWKEFGAVLKEGLAEDRANRDKLLPLLRFASTREEGNEPTVSLKQYVERMKEGQERIYYVIADSVEAARASPYIEQLKERGVEVLLLGDRIDEWVMGQIEEFEGKKLKDAVRGDLELGALAGEAGKSAQEEASKENKGLLKRVKDAVGDRVSAVRASTRLKDSPSVLVLGEDELGSSMRRVLLAAGQKPPESKPALELNVAHPLVKYLDGVSDVDQFAELAQLLYDQAALAEGGQLSNPAAYLQRLNRVLIRLAGAQGGTP